MLAVSDVGRGRVAEVVNVELSGHPGSDGRDGPEIVDFGYRTGESVAVHDEGVEGFGPAEERIDRGDFRRHDGNHFPDAGFHDAQAAFRFVFGDSGFGEGVSGQITGAFEVFGQDDVERPLSVFGGAGDGFQNDGQSSGSDAGGADVRAVQFFFYGREVAGVHASGRSD